VETERYLAVGLSSVRDPVDDYGFSLIIHGVEDAIISHSDPVSFPRREFSAARRSRISRKRLDSTVDPYSVRGRNIPDIPADPFFNEDSIAQILSLF
jgi:hypothetical protein